MLSVRRYDLGRRSAVFLDRRFPRFNLLALHERREEEGRGGYTYVYLGRRETFVYPDPSGDGDE